MIRTSSGRFVINDLILHIAEIFFIRKWQKCQIHGMHLRCRKNLFSLPISQAFDFPQCCGISRIQVFQIFCKNKLPFPTHDKIHRRIFPEKGFAFVADFRAAETNDTVRHDLFQNRTKLPQHLHIPDIAGKQHHIRLFAEQFLGNEIQPLVDGKFHGFHMMFLVIILKTGQITQCQIGMDVFCVQRR